MRTLLRSGIFVAGALALTACTSTQNSNIAAPTPQLTPVEAPKPVETPAPQVASVGDISGTWQPIDQAGKELGYRAAFVKGQFVSYDRQRTSADELLAKGTYRAPSISNISLNFVGAASGPNSANCRLLSSSRMNCTLKNGTPLFFKKVSSKA